MMVQPATATGEKLPWGKPIRPDRSWPHSISRRDARPSPSPFAMGRLTSPAISRRVCRARRRDNGRQRDAMRGPFAGIEIQPILLDRIERYRVRHKHRNARRRRRAPRPSRVVHGRDAGRLDNSFGATARQSGARRTLTFRAQPRQMFMTKMCCFEADRPATVHRGAKADCDGRY